MRVGFSRRRIVFIGLLAAWTASAVTVGCSSDETGPGPGDTDASPDGLGPDGTSPDGAIGDANVKDQVSPPVDAADAGDAGDGSVEGCAPSATKPCVRQVWSHPASTTQTCALIDKASGTGILECWGQTGVPLGLDGGRFDAGCTMEDGSPVCTESPVTFLYTPRIFPFEHAKYVGLAPVGAANRGHVCAIEWDAGGVRCWGSNRQGELGNNTTTSLPSPPSTSVLEGMDTVDVSGASLAVGLTCSRGTDASVYCWGRNTGGELGLGDSGPPAKSLVPLRLEGFAATQVVVTNSQVCAVRSGEAPGTIWCWGRNYLAEVPETWTTPTRLGDGLTGVVQIAHTMSTPNATICALLATKRVSCWGNNERAELGIDPTLGDKRRDDPIDMGLTDVQEIAAGSRSFCARMGSGAVKCWGLDTGGQCGVDPITGTVVTDGATNDKMVVTPTDVPGVTNAVQLAMGSEHSCARTADGGLKCWGRAYALGVTPAGLGGVAVATPVTVVGWE